MRFMGAVISLQYRCPSHPAPYEHTCLFSAASVGPRSRRLRVRAEPGRSRGQLQAPGPERGFARTVLLVRRQSRGDHGARQRLPDRAQHRAGTEGGPRPVSSARRGVPAHQSQPAGRSRCRRQGSSRVRHRLPDPGRRNAVDRRIAGHHPYGRVFVVDPRNWKLVYRGPVDDRLAYGAQRPAAAKHYLADALDAVLAGKAGRSPGSRGAGLPRRSAGARPARQRMPGSRTRNASRRCSPSAARPATARAASRHGP